VLLQDGPAVGGLDRVGQAEAQWFVPAGSQQSGVLTIATAPDIAGAAGCRYGSIGRVSQLHRQPATPP
jgi:hypothetical protein